MIEQGKRPISPTAVTLRAKGVRQLLATPTGRAAKRLSESSGLEAKTIHRLLEVDPAGGQFKRNAASPLDCDLLVVAEPEAIAQTVVDLVARRLPAKYALDPVRDIQVLCPMNRGSTGARSLNALLQAALNPPGDERVEKFGHVYGRGDKVMQIENNYDREVYNGDIGIVAALDAEEEELSVDFEGRRVAYPYGELDELVLCYATTIHKSQGSEYPAVVLPLAMQHYLMLERNLVYTGITRGKRLVVLVGQKRALAMAVKGRAGRRRWSKLKEWLAG